MPATRGPAVDVARADHRRRRPWIRSALTVAAAGLVSFPVFVALRHQDLVTGAPWVLACLVLVAGAAALAVVPPRARGAHGYGRLRLVAALAGMAALCWTAGWSLVLPAAGVLLSVMCIQRSGSHIWRFTGWAATVVTVAGQVATGLGWVPTIVAPAQSHVAAWGALTFAWLAVAVVGRGAAERETSQHTLARTEARLRALMDSSSDVLTVSNSRGLLTYVSPAVSRSLGYDPATLVGSPLTDLVDAEHRSRAARQLSAVVAAGPGARTNMDVLVVLASLERRWFEWTVHNLLDDPLVEGLVVDQRDVTERLVHHETLARAASHDELTGLANRSELMRRLETSLHEAAPRAGVAMLSLDLDQFKQVNDTFGHEAGDELLVAVARRLSSCVRPHDHLGRLGGDEFGVVLTEVRDEYEVRSIVQRVGTAIEQPITLAVGAVRVGVSIGYAMTIEPRTAVEPLFAAADAAMYRTKGSRRR